MTKMGHLLRAAMEHCDECIQTWALAICKDEENKLSVLHFLASTWTWSHEQVGLSFARLTEGEAPVYSSTSRDIIGLLMKGDVKELVSSFKELPPSYLLDILDDALVAAKIPKEAAQEFPEDIEGTENDSHSGTVQNDSRQEREIPRRTVRRKWASLV